jgi:hypothetical protein
VMATLRSFGLTDANNGVQPELIELSRNKGERKRIIGDLLRKHYPKAVELGEIKGTQRQLEEAFAEFKISGNTLRKAVAFYLKGAEYAGLPVSPHFRAVAKASAAPGGKNLRRPRSKQSDRAALVGDGSDQNVPNPDESAALDGLSEEYVKLLMKKVEAQETVDEKLLDRIERMLGRSPSS